MTVLKYRTAVLAADTDPPKRVCRLAPTSPHKNGEQIAPRFHFGKPCRSEDEITLGDVHAGIVTDLNQFVAIGHFGQSV